MRRRSKIRKPTLKRRKLSALRISGVYVLYSRGSAVYVGQSQDVQRRIGDHAWPSSTSKHAYRGGFDEYAIIRRPNLAERLELEKYLIAVFRPIGNKSDWPARTAFLKILSDPAFAPAAHRDKAEIAT